MAFFDFTGQAGPARIRGVAAGQADTEAANVGQVVRFWVGPDIDCFSAGATSIVIPAIAAGKVFLPPSQGMRWIVVSKTGTLTGAPIFKAGSNAAHDNLVASLTTTTVANLNGASAGYEANFGTSFLSGAFLGSPDLATSVVLELSTPATGTAALVIRPVFMGAIVAYP